LSEIEKVPDNYNDSHFGTDVRKNSRLEEDDSEDEKFNVKIPPKKEPIAKPNVPITPKNTKQIEEIKEIK